MLRNLEVGISSDGRKDNTIGHAVYESAAFSTAAHYFSCQAFHSFQLRGMPSLYCCFYSVLFTPIMSYLFKTKIIGIKFTHFMWFNLLHL